MKKEAKPAQPVPKETQPEVSAEPGVTTPEPVEKKPAKAAPAVAAPAGPLSQKEIYKRTLRATALVVAFDSAGKVKGNGTGWLLDKQRKIVITNHHVVVGSPRFKVYFPEKRDGELVSERAKYLESDEMNGSSAQVLFSEPERDLAALQLQSVPDDALAVSLATESPSPGEILHSIGNPGASDALWVYTQGTVRQVYHKKVRTNSGQVLDARLIETQAPINPGDSGGPVVNENGELTGVVSSFLASARLMTNFIDITEVRKFSNSLNEILDPKTAEVFVRRGVSHQVRGDYDRAVKDYTSAIRLDPRYPKAYLQRGTCFAARKDYSTSLADLDEAIKLDPTNAGAYIIRTEAFASQGGKSDAIIENCTQAIRLDPDNWKAYLYRGAASIDKRDYETAVQDLGRARELNKFATIIPLLYAQALQSKGNLDAAVNSYLDVIKLDPNHAEAYNKLGSLLMYGKQDARTAVKVFTAALEKNPQNALAVMNRGRAYFLSDQLQLSLQDLDAAVKLMPNNGLAYDFRGDIYLARREYPKALDEYQTATRLDPSNAFFQVDLGNAYSGLNRNADALEAYTRGIALSPRYAQAYVKRAICLFKLGRKSDSEEDVQKAKGLDSKLANLDVGIRRTRYLRVTNATSDQIEVSVQYWTKTVNGDFAWYPDAPGEKKAVVFKINSKQTANLIHNGIRVHAQKVRIWAQQASGGKTSTKYRDLDLFIAPSDGYVTAESETFDYTFNE